MENIVKTIKQEKFITKIDSLGRIVIPKELRENSKINTGDKLYVYRSGKNIILEKSNIKTEKEKIYQGSSMLNNEIEIHLDIYSIKNINSKSEKGILRTVDELGRYVIPIELRNELKIKEDNSFRICKKDDKIILIKEEYDRSIK